MRIAIDGPASAGKSSAARGVAERLGLAYLDTGAMYRALALKAARTGVDPADGPALGELSRAASIVVRGEAILLDGEDVSREIRSPEISALVSPVSAHPEVRSAMVAAQRELAARSGGVVLDGRDIGTHVLPDADVKVFLTASPGERARRRYLELLGRGYATTCDEVLADIERRDRFDSTRAASPLRAAPDAITIDTTGMTLTDVIARIMDECRRVTPCSM